jgi:hypothetical protein
MDEDAASVEPAIAPPGDDTEAAKDPQANRGISEAASENPPKRQRGRPPKWVKADMKAPYDYALEQAQYPTTQTRRGQQDRLYQEDAMFTLIAALEPGQGDRFHWLMGTIKPMKDENGQETWAWPLPSPSPFGRLLRLSGTILQRAMPDMKVAVLAELGRIVAAFSDGKQWAVKWADKLCQMEPKPSVKQAAAMLRRWRLDRDPKPGTWQELYEVIIDAIDAYEDRRAGVSPAMIEDALDHVQGYYAWLFEEDPADTEAAAVETGSADDPSIAPAEAHDPAPKEP